MSDWTPEADKAIRMCEAWAAKVAPTMSCQLFLFGSAIYKGGEQFDSESSDLDIVCLVPEPNCAITRLESLQILYQHKADLELEMIRILSRSTCTEAGISIVTTTQLEVCADIHKSGARSFFSKNIFLDLVAKKESLGLPLAGTRLMRDEPRQALEYVQRVRNEFLSVCANGTGGISEFRGSDPIPKPLLRAAAQLNIDAVNGEWYDTRLGLELMHSLLQERRGEHEAFKKLSDRVSIRRGGRGNRMSLSSTDQLLLAEMLFDAVASAVTTEEVVTWDIRLSGQTASPEDVKAAFDAVVRLVPDARLIGVRSGSLILRFRSSVSGYNVLLDLDRFGVLPRLLGVDIAELIRLDDPTQPQEFRSDSIEQALIDHIAQWKPQGVDSMIAMEKEFARYLEGAIETNQQMSNVRLVHNVMSAESGIEIDFVIAWQGPEGLNARLLIDLSYLRYPEAFYQKIARLLPLGLPFVLVAIASAALLERFTPDIDRLGKLNANIRVVPIALPG